MYIVILLILCAVTAFVYYYSIKPHSFWKNKGIKQSRPTILFGDNLLFKREPLPDMVERLYRGYVNDRYSGIYLFTKPILMVRDPELIKQLTIKDFDYFTDHMLVFPDETEPFWTKNLFALKGDKWKDMRATLSPAFTSSKMRAMFVLMSDCAERFINYFKDHQDECNVELLDVVSRYTNDVIASCAFGIECNSMENKTNDFYVMGKTITNTQTIAKLSKFLLMLLSPKLCKLLGISFFDYEVSSFFTGIIADTVKYREDNNISRPDLVQLLMDARKGQLMYDEKDSTEKDTGFATVEESQYGKVIKKAKDITIVDMTAQALIFFFAGFDSVATLMTFMGHELAVNPDIQERLYNEIMDTKEACKDGKITYEAINKMKYLDMVVAETLRRWPAAAAVDRECVHAYTIQAKTDDEKTVHLGEKDCIWLPIWGIHHDERYYPDPYKFDPERFSDENKGNIKPYTYLPFGVGPRNCIASRFALLEAKVLFYHLLMSFEIVVNEKTQIPLKIVNRGFSMGNEKGFNFTLKLRQ